MKIFTLVHLTFAFFATPLEQKIKFVLIAVIVWKFGIDYHLRLSLVTQLDFPVF